MTKLLLWGALLMVGGASCAESETSADAGAATVTGFKGEVWADNWFALYVGDSKVAEDAVPITQERSFNEETFTFEAEYPFELNFVIKDYKADDTGLEYIGRRNQQMGDGGFIMQLTDLSTGRVVAVSNADCKCLVIHEAPLDKACEKDPNPSTTCLFRSEPEPDGWKRAGFDASGWQNATVYTAEQIGVKAGYNAIAWDPAARLIWSSDLERDNTLLCKVMVTGS